MPPGGMEILPWFLAVVVEIWYNTDAALLYWQQEGGGYYERYPCQLPCVTGRGHRLLLHM